MTVSNKALAVLDVLREHGELTVSEVAEVVMERTPCGYCEGTGEGDGPRGCRRCYGRGRVPFYYSNAYQALRQLLGRGLVTRRHPLDEFGDETNWWVWRAVPVATGDEDPLEALFRAPAVEGRE